MDALNESRSSVRIQLRDGQVRARRISDEELYRRPIEVRMTYNLITYTYRFEWKGTGRWVEVDELDLVDSMDLTPIAMTVAEKLVLPHLMMHNTRELSEASPDRRREAQQLCHEVGHLVHDLISQLIGRRSVYRPFSDGTRTPYVPFTPLPTCAQCGKTGLTQTYTSTRDQREICADCFEGLQDKGLAREQGQPLKKKARHPLDAWMEE